MGNFGTWHAMSAWLQQRVHAACLATIVTAFTLAACATVLTFDARKHALSVLVWNATGAT